MRRSIIIIEDGIPNRDGASGRALL